MNKQSQSLFDFLVQVMPEFKDHKFLLTLKPTAKDPNAKKLYSLWSDAESKISDRKFRRPPTMSDSDLRSLERAGYVEIHGKDLKVTSNGVVILRKMILDDNSFHFNKKSECSNCFRKVASSNIPKKKISSWYERYTNAEVAS